MCIDVCVCIYRLLAILYGFSILVYGIVEEMVNIHI